jgi:hypothetical protein
MSDDSGGVDPVSSPPVIDAKTTEPTTAAESRRSRPSGRATVTGSDDGASGRRQFGEGQGGRRQNAPLAVIRATESEGV